MLMVVETTINGLPFSGVPANSGLAKRCSSWLSRKWNIWCSISALRFWMSEIGSGKLLPWMTSLSFVVKFHLVVQVIHFSEVDVIAVFLGIVHLGEQKRSGILHLD